MNDRNTPRPSRVPRPITQRQLEEMALRYVARYATSTAKLRDYLQRKLRERGWAEDTDADVETLISRYAGLGYVDDKSFAITRSESLLRRGYGTRRVSQSLHHAGIGSDLQDSIRPTDHAQRQAVLALAKRRRFGPFASAPVPPEKHEKQLAAMLRAGHRMEHVRAVLNAGSVAAAEAWVEEAWDKADGDAEGGHWGLGAGHGADDDAFDYDSGPDSGPDPDPAFENEPWSD